MKSEYEIYPVMIVCPECKTIQGAIVEDVFPWGIYVHHCVECKYVITESEWEEVKPFKQEPVN